MPSPNENETAALYPVGGAAGEQLQALESQRSANASESISSPWQKFNIRRPKQSLQFVDGDSIMNSQMPDLIYTVDKILPHGIFILAGEPKIGKSWLTQQLAYAVASQGEFLGYQANYGEVIYLALEDNPRRLHDRYERYKNFENQICGMKNIHFSFQARTLDDDFLGQIFEALEQYPNTDLVIIDTMQYIRGKVSDKYSYETEYKMMVELRKITASYDITLILVTHTREMKADDPQRQIYGGGGLIGGSDGNWVLAKSSDNWQSKEAVLYITNRDTESAELSLVFDQETLMWTVTDCREPRKTVSREDCLISALTAIMATTERWEGTASDLCRALDEASVAGNAPEYQPNALSRWLGEAKNQRLIFEKCGVAYRKINRDKCKIITLTGL